MFQKDIAILTLWDRSPIYHNLRIFNFPSICLYLIVIKAFSIKQFAYKTKPVSSSLFPILLELYHEGIISLNRVVQVNNNRYDFLNNHFWCIRIFIWVNDDVLSSKEIHARSFIETFYAGKKSKFWSADQLCFRLKRR